MLQGRSTELPWTAVYIGTSPEINKVEFENFWLRYSIILHSLNNMSHILDDLLLWMFMSAVESGFFTLVH